jgi:hypothetical protein
VLSTLASQPTQVFTKQEPSERCGAPTGLAPPGRSTVTPAGCAASLAEAGATNAIVNVWGVGYGLVDTTALVNAA